MPPVRDMESAEYERERKRVGSIELDYVVWKKLRYGEAGARLCAARAGGSALHLHGKRHARCLT